MKSRNFILAIAIAVVTVLTMGLTAQDEAAPAEKAQHHHYALIDLQAAGGLGGPQSGAVSEGQSAPGIFWPPPAYAIPQLSSTRMLNAKGMLTGFAELNFPDPYPDYCLGPDCLLLHSFLSQGGKMIDLSAIGGDANDSFPNWINDLGEVVGASFNGTIDGTPTGAPLLEATLWKNGKVIDLKPLQGGNQSIAFAINNWGDVVGAAANGTADPFGNIWGIDFFANSNQAHAVLWRRGMPNPIDLGTLGGGDSVALFINDFGQIVGQSLIDSNVQSTTGQPTQHPFIWQNGKMQDLLPNPESKWGTFGFPTDFNNLGQVVGVMNLAGDTTFHPFFWGHGQFIDIGTLGGDLSAASWINDAGEVLGTSLLPGNVSWQAFIWRKEMKQPQTLGTLDTCSDADNINLRGQAVGLSTDCHTHIGHAFLWENNEMVDLLALVVPPTSLTGADLDGSLFINDRGEISAVTGGKYPHHAILFIPCDENHPGVEGCDYSMVDASTVAAAGASVKEETTTGIAASDTKTQPGRRRMR